jgi:hypothetical protein
MPSRSLFIHFWVGLAGFCLLSSPWASAFELPPLTKDGWQLVGISAKSRIFWIRPSSIKGEKANRTSDLLEFEPPGPFSRATTLHINCIDKSTWLSRGGQRTSQILTIARGSVWESISKILCRAA